MPNFNISPHHPAAALLWLESWRLKTGETLDGAFSADVVALGDLVTATGEEVPLPDGGSLTGAELTQFAISGVYEKFPEVADVPARKAYQNAVTAAALDIVIGSPNRAALASAFGSTLSEHRVLLWCVRRRHPAAHPRRRPRRVPGSARRSSRGVRRDQLGGLEAGRLPAAVADLRGGPLPRPGVGARGLPVDIALTNAIPEGADGPRVHDLPGRARPRRADQLDVGPGVPAYGCRDPRGRASTASRRATRRSGSRTGRRSCWPWSCPRARSAPSASSSASRPTTAPDQHRSSPWEPTR